MTPDQQLRTGGVSKASAHYCVCAEKMVQFVRGKKNRMYKQHIKYKLTTIIIDETVCTCRHWLLLPEGMR
jgi:hypothetical protein